MSALVLLLILVASLVLGFAIGTLLGIIQLRSTTQYRGRHLPGNLPPEWRVAEHYGQAVRPLDSFAKIDPKDGMS